jgi:NAD+ synthase (glutamine-hydrolysing)
MSHYAVNASVPKTLIQHVIRWVADTDRFGPEVSRTLIEILATQISPELVPGKGDSEPAQDTEAMIGPYELHDFNLYYTLRFGYPPPKIAFLEYCAWRDREHGRWPDISIEKRNQYDLAQIKAHLHTFLYRFFKLSQFKRSCIPNAPKVGSGGSLSPRGDYRAPSDSEADAWLKQLDLVPAEDSSGAASRRTHPARRKPIASSAPGRRAG